MYVCMYVCTQQVCSELTCVRGDEDGVLSRDSAWRGRGLADRWQRRESGRLQDTETGRRRMTDYIDVAYIHVPVHACTCILYMYK